MHFFQPTINEDTVIAFIKWHFGNAEHIFDEPIYDTFKALIVEGKDIAAAKEYCELTGLGIDEAHLAIQVAKRLRKTL